MRIFAFNSLISFFKNEWTKISQQKKEAISSIFPFHVENDVVNPQYLSIASKCVASYLSYAGNEHDILIFMNSYNNNSKSHYFAASLNHFILFLFDPSYPANRTKLLSAFISEHIVTFVQNLLF